MATENLSEPAMWPTVEQCRVACDAIAQIAYRLDREFYFGQGDPSDSEDGEIPERSQLFLDRLRDAISHIGWLAEQAAPGVVHSDNREWLLPPTYFFGTRESTV